MVARPVEAALSLLVTAVLLAAFVPGASANEFIGTVEAFIVVTNDDGSESFVPARNAHPGDVLEYRIRYENEGSEPITGVSIVDAIPFGVVCIPETVSQPEDCKIEFSIDGGKSFHPWPIKLKVVSKDGREEWEEATPDMITHVRWVFSTTFESNEEVKLTYRVTIR